MKRSKKLNYKKKRKIMKKILFVLMLCVGLASCGYSQKEIEELNSEAIRNEVLNACIEDLKDNLRDPSSLKIDGPILLSTIITSREAAAKSTKLYADFDELYNDKYSDKTSIKKHMDDVIETFDLVSEHFNCTYYIISFKYYAKNGFGAYTSDYIKYIVSIHTPYKDKDGLNVYRGHAHEASWSDKFNEGYTAEVSESDGRGWINIPEQYKMN